MLLKIKILEFVKNDSPDRRLSGCHEFEITVNSDHIIDIQPVKSVNLNGTVIDESKSVVFNGFVIHLSDGRKINSLGEYKQTRQYIDNQLAGVC